MSTVPTPLALAAVPPDSRLRRAGRAYALLAMFAALPAMLALPSGPRLFWTVAIAALPLLIVVIGFHNWREICPLAQTAQLARHVGRGGRRRAGRWLEQRYPLVQFGLLYLCLCLRLLATNGDGAALGLFLAVLFLAALLSGARYTGKTWCNFFCPVGVVERIYTEPESLTARQSSRCDSCSGCKRSCPDIDLGQAYRKDAGLRAKALATYGFPGLVFGFYFYYWVASGSWRYYFSGAWTREPGLWRRLDAPGAWFWPALPRAAAAPLTLLVCAAATGLLFLAVERLLSRDRALTLAAFVAFNVFYLFAGAPTLGRWPALQRVVHFAVTSVSSLSVMKRWRQSAPRP